jgi:hypothetical protein
MRINGKDFDIVWETRKRPEGDRPMGEYTPEYGEYIGLLSKEGKVIDSKMIYGLYAENDEIDDFAQWLKMSQYGPKSGIYGYSFIEPCLELEREILNPDEVRITFVFDWREDKPDIFSILTTEQELAIAADKYLEEHKE